MLELLPTIIWLCHGVRQKNKGMQMLEEARLKYDPSKSRANKYKHHSLDMWCESWLVGCLPNEILLERFEKREDGHWYRKEDKGDKA